MSKAALAEILGYEGEERPPIEIVEQGLPYEAVERVARMLDITKEELCQLLPVSRRTLVRRHGAKLDSHLSDHLMMLSKIYDRSVEVLGSPEYALIWIKTPNYTFRYKRPLEYLATFVGGQEILDELVRLQHGVYV